MNLLFVIILVLLGILMSIFNNGRRLISNYINLGYIISLTLIWNNTLSIQYYTFILITMSFFYIFEIIFDKIEFNYRYIIDYRSKLFKPLLIINVISFIIMFINFIYKFGFLNPLKYSSVYENNLYMSGLTIIYRSIIPLFIYSVYKIFNSKSHKSIYYFTVIYSFTTLFIKFNKTDIAVLLLIIIIVIYERYFTNYIAIKYKARALVIIAFLAIMFIFYFSSFYNVIFRDDIEISSKIILYTSGGQIYLDHNIKNGMWSQFKDLNFLNVLKGYNKPSRIVIGSISTNVYGLFGDIFNDFYYYGIIIGPFIINFIFYILKKITRNNLIGYIFLASYFTLAFFNPYVLLKEFWVQVFFIALLSINKRNNVYINKEVEN